jgi:hypothetical protein
MDGVILFVDDKAHDCCVEDGELKRTPENQLFELLRRDYPVLGVKDLDLAERAIKSIGSFAAIILDWMFDDKELLGSGADSEDIGLIQAGSIKEDRTLRFLEDNDFYSLVYVYSTEDIEERYGARLKARFGERIQFERKDKAGLPSEGITKRIEKWKEQHRNLAIPLAWTATINLAIQQIFKELAEADLNWIREIGNSAKEDGVSGEVFIIEILQYLLAESLTQNPVLLSSIKDYLNSESAEVLSQGSEKEESVAKLFRRLFYTKLTQDSSIMTGDICELDENKFGIIITPECDVKDVISGKITSFELLTFSKGSFDAYLLLDNYERSGYSDAGVKKLDKFRKLFNQNDTKYHVLPSFPFEDASMNLSVLLDFSKGCERYTAEQVKPTRKYKLNGPFIQQLRQRYISHLGRVGVPSLPTSLRNFNLK